MPDNLPSGEPEPTAVIPAPAGQPVTAQSAPPAPPAAAAEPPASAEPATVAQPAAAEPATVSTTVPATVAQPAATEPATVSTTVPATVAMAAPAAASPVPTSAAVAVAEPPAVPVEDKPAAKPKRKRGVLSWVIFGVIVVLLLGAAYLLYVRLNSDPTKDAVVGNCLADLPAVAVGEDQAVGRARIVDCADPSAVYLVRGRLDGQTQAQATDPTVCQQFEDSRYVYRAVPTSGTGYVLCLHKLDE